MGVTQETLPSWSCDEGAPMASCRRRCRGLCGPGCTGQGDLAGAENEGCELRLQVRPGPTVISFIYSPNSELCGGTQGKWLVNAEQEQEQ